MTKSLQKTVKMLLTPILATSLLLCSCNKSNNIDEASKMRYTNFTYTEKKTAEITKSAACPFTEEEMNEQIAAGRKLVEDIYAAAADLSISTFTIPKGNYGFKAANMVSQVNSAFYLHDIERPDDNPLTIICDDVTFWIKPTGLPCANTSRAFHIRHCSNLKFVNLTIDEYSPTDFEGTVTQIDYENNRIAIKLNNNSMVPTKTNMGKAVAGNQSRIIPFKANGDLIASYYRIDSSWGPGNLWVNGFEATGNEDEYWLSFETDLLLKTNNNKEWIDAYGSAGIIEIGDTISYLYANMTINLDNSKQITMEGLKSRLSKGMPSENGGYGNHTWKECVFGPEDGTGKFIGASEYMINAVRHGPTIENCTLLGSSDDQINIHAYWGKISKVEGNKITVSSAMCGLLEGDPIELYDSYGKLVTTLTLASTPTGDYRYDGFLFEPLEVTGEIPANYESLIVRYPTMNCDGWVIKNNTFMNNYQRLYIQAGNGTFENNKIILMGDNVSIETTTRTGLEGGFLGDIVFKNNVFVSSAIGPDFTCLAVAQTPEWATRRACTITFENNAFVNCGNLLTADSVDTLIFKNNIIIEPSVVNKKFTAFEDLLGVIKNVNDRQFENNLLLSSDVTKKTENQQKISESEADKARIYARYSSEDASVIVHDLWEVLK